DLNGDGFPDLYVCHYVDWSFQKHPRCAGYRAGQPVDTCSPKQFSPLMHALYLNNGNGTFREVTEEVGLKLGKGLGVLIVDLDGDGKPDIYVANDTTDNLLYLNRGGGKFEEVAVARSAAASEGGKPDGSMGVDAADYDGTGLFSIFVTNFQFESHAL